MTVGRWHVIEDIALADVALAIDGATPADLFETAARALAELMLDPTALPLSVTRETTLSAPATDLLLYDWLSELIVRKDRDGEVFPDTRVTVQGNPPCRLAATLRGGRIAAAAAGQRADVKAVTLHRFVVERRDDGWHAEVVLDV